MDKENEKKLEAFVDKIMLDVSLETPSEDFTEKLMARIVVESNKKVLEPSPLMPKGVLVFLFSLFSALLLYVLFFYGIDTGEGWFQQVQFSPYFERIWTWFETYTSSKIILYSVVLFGFLFTVQLPFLKRYLDHHGTLG